MGREHPRSKKSTKWTKHQVQYPKMETAMHTEKKKQVGWWMDGFPAMTKDKKHTQLFFKANPAKGHTLKKFKETESNDV